MGIFREYMSYTQFQYSYILQGSFCFEPFQLFWGSLLWPTLTHFFIVFHSESLKGCPDSLLARVSGLSPPSETNFLTTFCLKAQFDQFELTFCAAFESNRMFFRNCSCSQILKTLEIIDITTSTASVQLTGFYCFAYKVKILMILTYPKLQCYRKIIRPRISFSPS